MFHLEELVESSWTTFPSQRYDQEKRCNRGREKLDRLQILSLNYQFLFAHKLPESVRSLPLHLGTRNFRRMANRIADLCRYDVLANVSRHHI